jgi:hypothetical protein
LNGKWLRNYRPLAERSESVQEIATRVLVLPQNSSPRLTTNEIGRITRYYRTKTQSFLGMLRHERVVDKAVGVAAAHPCAWIVCRCHGYAITESGRAYLAERSAKE